MSYNEIQNGLNLLNQKNPEWFKKIDLDILDMNSVYHCILGQVYGGYEKGKQEIGIDNGIYYGFAPEYAYRDPQKCSLTQEWKEAILKLREEEEEKEDFRKNVKKGEKFYYIDDDYKTIFVATNNVDTGEKFDFCIDEKKNFFGESMYGNLISVGNRENFKVVFVK